MSTFAFGIFCNFWFFFLLNKNLQHKKKMHHPIQMKPADTENRNGVFFVHPIIYFINFNGIYIKYRTQTIHWNDLTQL